jgi:hypothetical protein
MGTSSPLTGGHGRKRGIRASDADSRLPLAVSEPAR